MRNLLLSPRQQAFCEAFAMSGNAAAAARDAGYAARSARQIANELLTKPYIQAALQAHRAEIAARMDITRQVMLDGLLEAIQTARETQDPAGMIRGWAEIGRLCGFYAPEQRIKVDVNIAAKRFIGQLETMSDVELMDIVKREASLFGG